MFTRILDLLKDRDHKLKIIKNIQEIVDAIGVRIQYLASLKKSDPGQSRKITQDYSNMLDELMRAGATAVDLYHFLLLLDDMCKQEYAVAKIEYNKKMEENRKIIKEIQEAVRKHLIGFDPDKKEERSDNSFIIAPLLTEDPFDDDDFTCIFGAKNDVVISSDKIFQRQHTKESQYSGFFTRVEGEEKMIEPDYVENIELNEYRVVRGSL